LAVPLTVGLKLTLVHF